MSKEARIVLPSENKPEVDETQVFLDTLNQIEQRSLLDFFQGARFMQSLMTSTQPPVAQDNA